ncbi:MAG: LuxR C-terminal-related transcriptional regulator [Solirubrobacteraceae bacterium]
MRPVRHAFSGRALLSALSTTTAGVLPSEDQGERAILFPSRDVPLVGRSRELDLIAHARASGAAGVVVRAPAGVGKSRLARAALARVEADGARTAWVQATRSAASVPLGAFAGAIPADVGSDDPFELLRRGARAMTDSADGHALVVAVDDAQLLDPTSAALVLQLTCAPSAFVLATVRSGDPCPDAIVSLWKDAGAERLELSALSREETDQLVEAIVGGPVESGAREWIWKSSQGNALYANELTRGALNDGVLELVSGLWRMPERPRISPSLAELISAGMAEIEPGERSALEFLALGEPLPMRELIQLTDETGVAMAEARGLITVDSPPGDQLVRLAHPVYGEAMRDSLPSLRMYLIRVQLARIVQARDELRSEDSLRVARWLLDAGEPVPRALLLEAAETANRGGDPDLAERLAHQALDAGIGVDAALVLARSHSIRNQFERAEEVLAAAESAIESQDQALRYLTQQVRVLYSALHHPDELRGLLRRAQQWWADDAWRVRLAPLRLYVESRASAEGRQGVIDESGELLRLDALDPEARRTVQLARLSALFYAGRGREAWELAALDPPPVPVRDAVDEAFLSVRCGASVETGEGLSELERWARAVLPRALRIGDDATAGMAALALAHRCLPQGRFRDAGRWLTEAQLHQEQHDPDGKLAMTFALQAWVACARGDVEASGRALTRCRGAVRGEELSPFQAVYLACAEAWAGYATCDREASGRALLDRARALRDVPLCEARLLYEAMRIGAPPREVVALIAAAGERCDAPLVAARVAHVGHRAARDAKGLMKTVDAFEAIGASLYAAEAAAQAAELFVRDGRSDSARRAAARVRELFPANQGGTLGPIDGLDRDLVDLTGREAQLVELASAGLSNQEIAQRLVLSVRTVESHLYRAMRKLGVSDRREL